MTRVTALLGKAALAAVCVGILAPQGIAAGRIPEFERYRIDHTRSVLDEDHLRLVSGTLSLGPSLLDAASVRRLYSPPFVSSDFDLSLEVNGRPVPLESFVWYPNEIQRTGRSGNIAAHTSLLPLRQARAFLELIRLENLGTSNEFVEIALRVSGTLDRAPSERWQYSPPRSATPALASPFHSSAKEDDLSDAGFVLENAQGRITACLIGDHPGVRGAAAVERVTLQPGITRHLTILVVLGEIGAYKRLRENLEETLAQNDRLWQELHASLRAAAPELITDHTGLSRFYDRGFLPLLLNRWDLPEFTARPHYALDGLDGGGFCTYVWDMAYVAEYLVLTQPDFARAQIERFLAIDLTQSYAISPLTGSGVGRWYAYNNYSLMRLLLQYVLVSGDSAFLAKSVAGRSVLDWALWLARWPAKDDTAGLLDYGDTDNLLELRKTRYEHFVPSPNAERVASMRFAAELCRIGGKSAGNLNEQADALARVITDKLWVPELKWMTTLDLQNGKHTVYTVQVFDLLRLGILPREMADAVVSHLNEREFLSPYGLHSLSKLDPGYDERDVDWGGPGTYAGDAPELVEDLYRAGYPAQAEDLLRRILWWGERFPYLPQAIRADRTDYRHDGLANVISGLAAAQSVVFGLFGVELEPGGGGRLSINPHRFAAAGHLELRNVKFRNKSISVHVLQDSYQVTVDGTTVQKPLGTAFHLSGEK